MKAKIFGGLLLLVCGLPVAQASLVTVEYNVSINMQYDFNLGQRTLATPLTGSGSFTYDDSFKSASYMGSTVYASFGLNSPLYGFPQQPTLTTAVSPLRNYINLGVFNQLNTSIGVNLNYIDGANPLPYAFLGSMGYTTDPNTGLRYSYNNNLNMPVYGNDLNGDGISDFNSITAEKMFTFWQSNLGKSFVYYESFFIFPADPGPQISSTSWFGNFSITKVDMGNLLPGSPSTEPANAVPEPGTIALMVGGLALLNRRLKKRARSVN